MTESSDTTRLFYDAEASSYDETRYSSTAGRRVDVFQRRLLRTLSDLESNRYANVLEIGCGTGRLLPVFAAQADSLTGIDASSAMLQVAEQRKNKLALTRVELLQGDALDLPFPDDCFDLVYSILVINLIPEYSQVFGEVRRVLKNDGKFLFSVPNLRSIYYPAGYVVNRRGKAFGKNASGQRYSHWFKTSEIDSALCEASLKRVKLLGQAPWVRFIDDTKPLTDGICGRFLAKSIYICATAS